MVQPFVLNFHTPFTYQRISIGMPLTTLIGQPCFSDSIHLGAVLCHAYLSQNGCCIDRIEKIYSRQSSVKTYNISMGDDLFFQHSQFPYYLIGDPMIKI